MCARLPPPASPGIQRRPGDRAEPAAAACSMQSAAGCGRAFSSGTSGGAAARKPSCTSQLQQLKPLTPLHLKPSPQLRVAPAQLVCREGHRRLCCCWFRGAGALQLAGPPGLPHLLVPTYVCTSGEHLTCHNNLPSARVLPGCCEQHCNLGAVPRAPILQAEDGRDQADQAHPPGRACPRPGACRGPCPRPDAGSAAQARRGAVARVSHRAVRPSCTAGSLPRRGRAPAAVPGGTTAAAARWT
jgi:hypothetical protein